MGQGHSSACNVACSNVASNGELFPRVGFIVTNLGQPAKRVVPVLQPAGTAEQWIKDGNAVRMLEAMLCLRLVENRC